MGGVVGSIVKPVTKILNPITGGVGEIAGGVSKGLFGEAFKGQGLDIDKDAFKFDDKNQQRVLEEFGRGSRARDVAQSQQLQSRQGQQELIQALQKRAANIDSAPSLAAAQLKSASDRSLAQQLAAAGAARGGNQAALQRQLQQSQAQQGQQLAQQSAEAALVENMQRQQLAGQLEQQALAGQSQMRGQELDQQQFLENAIRQDLARGIGLDQAKQQAQADYQRLLVNQNLGLQGIRQKGVEADRKTQAGVVDKGLGAILSDKRMKKDVRKADKDIKSFLDALGAYKYEYKNSKDKGADKGTFISPMAQELEKTAMGKSMVVNGGKNKMVDYARGFGAILAAQSHLNKRLADIESKKKKRK